MFWRVREIINLTLSTTRQQHTAAWAVCNGLQRCLSTQKWAELLKMASTCRGAALRDGRKHGALGGGAGLQGDDIKIPVADALHICLLALLHLLLRLHRAA